MKKIYTICAALLITVFAGIDMLHAQDAEPTRVLVRDLQSYDAPLTSQTDLPRHPLRDSLVTFDAVVISYPKNSGLASISDAGVPDRIHVFVTDVNAAEMGMDGMSMQIVVEGAQRETLEALVVGDVINVVGVLTFFGNVSQFAASDVTQLGNVFLDEEYEGLESFFEPTVIELSELNVPSETEGRHRWNPDGYSKYNHRYVKLEGLEVIGRIDAPTGRPWFVLSDGTSILYSNDTSLRFRNNRGFGYAYNSETGQGLDYNWRRLAEDLDGPFTPPPAGAIVDVSGYIVVNTFNPAGFDESSTTSTLKIAPWDDGILWTQDGDDTEFRLTDGINNDLVVKGFPALIDNVQLDVEAVTSADLPTISADVLLPEDDYTLNSVSITFSRTIFTSDEPSAESTSEMTASGDTYSFTFPSAADFTVWNYTITAVAETPDGIETTARYTGSFDVVNSAVTSPVAFSPAAGTYENLVEVELSSHSEGATIYYTTDGSEPTTASTEYTGAISLTETTTIRAIAKAADLDASPVNSRTYTVVVAATEVSTLAELRTGYEVGSEEVFNFNGDAVVTFTRSSRNQKYIMDSTGGMLIDDNPGAITSSYAIGDIMTGLLGTMTNFNQLVQFNPAGDVPNSGRTAEIIPFVVTIPELTIADHESALVTLNNVRFKTPVATFPSSSDRATSFVLVDSEGKEIDFRTTFSEADYMGQAMPTSAFNLTALVGNFRGTLQVTARSTADFNFDVSNERFDGAYEFQLAQNYPNPFNPSTSISYSVAEMTNVTLTVYDILGRVVATLVNDVHSPGQYNVNFDATRLSSGTYIYRIEAGDFMSTKKMLLIK